MSSLLNKVKQWYAGKPARDHVLVIALPATNGDLFFLQI